MTATLLPDPAPDDRIRIETPAEVDVVLVCPACGAVESVGAKLATRLVITRGEASRLSLRVRSLRLEHACGQATLSSLARDEGDT
jgi:hypothetical protein